LMVIGAGRCGSTRRRHERGGERLAGGTVLAACRMGWRGK
jgi:hypothetical protein